MSEIRKDYFIDRFVIVSTEKTEWPEVMVPRIKRDVKIDSNCAFCPGNESSTPPADLVFAYREGCMLKLSDEESEPVKGWIVRAFPSRHPLVSIEPPSAYSDRPLYSEPAYGYHCTVVATPDHVESFSKMSVEQWINVLTIVQDKARWLYGRKKVAYISIFINHGETVGSESHPHIHMVTLPRIPPIIEAETMTVQKSIYDLGVCPMCTVVNVESGGPRQILATDFFLAFAPWASIYPYEFWIFPKKHQTSFLKSTQKEISDLATILRSTLGGLSTALNDPPFDLAFHISSEKKTTRQLHWHIEVYPQQFKWEGLERGSGIYINPVPPEKVAEELGRFSRRESALIVGIK